MGMRVCLSHCMSLLTLLTNDPSHTGSLLTPGRNFLYIPPCEGKSLHPRIRRSEILRTGRVYVCADKLTHTHLCVCVCVRACGCAFAVGVLLRVYPTSPYARTMLYSAEITAHEDPRDTHPSSFRVRRMPHSQAHVCRIRQHE